jgi:hypothetical protein
MLPVTLATAGLMGLIFLFLGSRVSGGRMKYRISLGDGGNTDMQNRIRAHANFAEFVPLILILMGLLELAGVNATILVSAGAVLAIARILHVIGMPMKAPNPYRFLGATGTYLLVLAGSVYALVLALG